MRRRFTRMIMLLGVVGTFVALAVLIATLAVSAEPAARPAPAVAGAEEPPALARGASALSKLHPDLREAAQNAMPAVDLPGALEAAAAQEPAWVEVVANTPAEQMDLAKYFVDGRYTPRPALSKNGQTLQRIIGQVMPYNLAKLAGVAEVQAVLPISFERTFFPDLYPNDDPTTIPVRGPEDWARLQARAGQVRAGTLDWAAARAFGDGRAEPQTRDWFDVHPAGPHKAEVAWNRGYQGEGVTVAVLDDGVDPAHPDLMGTQKIYSSAAAPQYNGWPMVFSPFSQFLWFLDRTQGTTYVADGYPGIHFVDTSDTISLSPCAPNASCFSYTPLIDFGMPGNNHTYVISDSMTSSGVVHVGTHPDNDLRDYVWGEKPAVVVVDPNTPGVYDTVLVDLDNDYDFRDEKPLTRADPANPSTHNNMVAYRDFDGDGLADISGGMVYFIADGVNCIPASDYMWGCRTGNILVPGNGNLVAFSGSTFDRAYSHGTQCASNIVGQGRTDWLVPIFSDLPGSGVPAGAVFGMAPSAKIVNVSDIYYNFESSTLDGYIFNAIGYDGVDQTGFNLFTGNPAATDTDAIQVTSNSYGNSAQDNDGWDFQGQVVSQLQRWWAPYQQYMFSTGNGAPAHGTVAPPSPDTAVGVGASTLYGSTGWDSITETTQMMYNDVTSFSNRGPGARGTNGADVVANGARGAGAEELNYYSISTWGDYDGNKSWVTWGGTSRSAPVAAGVMALIYQAYKDAHGTWPDYATAKALLMSTATDLDYDVYTQGGGSVNADRGTAVASGQYGVYVTDSNWQPGDYRGKDYPGFAHIVMPGETHTKTFTVHNPTTDTITVQVDDVELKRIDATEFDFTVTPDMVDGESAYGANHKANFYKAFHYLIPLTSENGDWNQISIPAGTDLMIVRQIFDYSQFDPETDYEWDNRFYLGVYNWQDVNGDGDVWEDKNSNGVVNIINAMTPTIDYGGGGTELAWGDPRNELDRWEYGRFDYNRPGANSNELWVRDPQGRMMDGLFIGLYHNPDSIYDGATTLRYRVEFYEEEDADWLSTNANSLNVPAGGMVDFVATIDVPAGIPTGAYEAAIQVSDPGKDSYASDTAVIPVAMSVGAEFQSGMQLGGLESYNYDQDRPYNNGAVRGLFDWTWRAESGDWRFFFVDVDNQGIFTATLAPENETHPVTTSVASGTAMFTLTAESGRLDYYLNFTGIQAPTAAHIHRGAAGVAGPVAYWLYHAAGVNAPPTVPAQGTVWLSDADVGRLLSGELYVNVHSNAYPAGEIRDQLHRADSGDLLTGNAQVLVKDEWNDAAPHTDIDTIVLGPAPSQMGTYFLDAPEPGYFGPYVLNTVGSSPNTNISGGIWTFDTSSGGNVDWIAARLQDGLHEFLQHNVLFQGDKFDVVFTKTVGTLESTPIIQINTYEDVSTGHVVDVLSSLGLSGLTVDVFGLGSPEFFDDVPIDFTGAGTIEWTDAFTVDHGAKIDISTSSSIPDIDLYLYYCGPTGATCALAASSATGTSNEFVSVLMPDDGVWVVGIDNWSGPAGTFNMTRIVVQGNDLTVANVPSGPIAAGTPASFTIGVSKEMEPGTTYEGLILAGPPDAPALLEIPVIVNRLSAVYKWTDSELVFPGSEVTYWLELYNDEGTPATFTMTDTLPTGLEYVSVAGGASYNSGNRTLTFSGTVTDTKLFTLTTRVALTQASTTITNTARASAPALFTGETAHSAVIEVADPGAFGTSTMSANSSVKSGGTITYQMVVSNTGQTLTPVTVTGTVPANTTFDGIESSPEIPGFGYDSASRQVQWTGQIAPGDARTFIWYVVVDEAPALWGETLTGRGMVTADGAQVMLSATTEVVPPYEIILPQLEKQP